MRLVARSLALAVCACAVSGCDTMPDLDPAMFQPPGPSQDVTLDHRGPEVYFDRTGTARFVPAIYEAFRPNRARDVAAFADQYFRAPASPGYDAVLDRVVEVLREAGFGTDPRLELEVVETEQENPAWTPVRGKLELLVEGGEPELLHGFESEEGRDRTMLPVNAPSASVEGRVVFGLAEVEAGDILVSAASARQVLVRAKASGAAAVLSASLYSFNVDPSGAERHLDAIQFTEIAADGDLPVCQISPRTLTRLKAAAEAGEVRVRFEAEVALEDRPLRTVIATVVGAKRPGEVVGTSSHVQEPGACDNASGLASLLESARSLAGLLQAGELEWPDRSVAFVWGDEYRQTQVWLDHTERTPVAGLSSDMTGQSAETGAIALLERYPDPGAVTVLPPDEHTPWGAWDVEDEWLEPNGLSVIARCALADVAVEADGWTTADHPWEGGSDHDVFIKMGVPAVLFWHFTDFTYHTSLDRMEFLDPEEMRRTGCAILATALAMADPRPEDLDRYIKSVQREREVRVAAAQDAGREDTAEAWKAWCTGARMWLRLQCLGPDAVPPPAPRDR